MLSSLVESGRRPGAARRAVPATLASALFHGGVLAGAVALTMPSPVAVAPARPVIDLTLPPREPGPVAPAPEEPGPLTIPTLGGGIPVPDFTVPDHIPPIDLSAPPLPVHPLGPQRQIPWGVPGGSPTAGPPRTWATAEVDEPPELISAPPATYPRRLQEAGIEGNVVLEAVIGIDGRPERGSIRIVSATRPEFEGPARDMLLGARFRPGRIRSEKVRVVVRLPVVFRIAR
jgi:TonB family protein